jgi:hypothetical protein
MHTDFDIGEIYRRLMAGWSWVLGAALIGGLLGLLVSSLRPPLYEAKAVVGIAIDRSRADVPDDVTVRQAYDRVRGLLLADDTLETAAALAAQRAGESPSPGAVEALTESIRLSERPDGWVLAVYGPNAIEAEETAQAWAEVAVDQLRAASVHALRAAEWQELLFEASCELVPQDQADQPARWVCRSAPPSGQAEMIPVSILAEVEATRGILPVLTYSLLKGAGGTAEPVVWSRGSLVLGGAVLGLVVGALVVASRRRADPHLH